MGVRRDAWEKACSGRLKAARSILDITSAGAYLFTSRQEYSPRSLPLSHMIRLICQHHSSPLARPQKQQRFTTYIVSRKIREYGVYQLRGRPASSIDRSAIVQITIIWHG